MKRTSANSLSVPLMLSSIVLLLVLQGLWLRGAYRDAEDDFRKETNLLFRNTIFAMQDSVLWKSMHAVPPDSVQLPLKTKRFAKDSIRSGRIIITDSSYNYISITEKMARVEMSSVSEHDSIPRMLRPLITRIQSSREPKTFIFRMGPDSLKSDSIEFHFQKALDKAGIKASFNVVTIRPDPFEPKTPSATERGKLVSEVVRLNPRNHYAVTFAGTNGLLLREITPEILFCIFLTLLTIGSFYLMYRNMRSQQRLMQIKNDFISNITHELKTPVATVSVALEALKNFHALDNAQRTAEYLDIAKQELNRLALMTEKILTAAVFEENGVDLKIENVDIDKLIQQVIGSMKPVFEKRGSEVQYARNGSDFTVEASPTHLTNVLYNLIDNALKYSSETATLALSVKEDRDGVTFSVADSGIGIAPEYQQRIFEKFFRVPSGDTHNIKGYGLGLSYVASVIERHGGNISVESTPGKGSHFQITLPRTHENKGALR